MAIQSFRKQGGGTEEVFRAQSNSENAFGMLGRALIVDGTLLEGITIGTSSTSIEHKLGRDYRGYIICKNDTFCYVKANTDTNKKLFINLQASAQCVVSLWVF